MSNAKSEWICISQKYIAVAREAYDEIADDDPVIELSELRSIGLNIALASEITILSPVIALGLGKFSSITLTEVTVHPTVMGTWKGI